MMKVIDNLGFKSWSASPYIYKEIIKQMIIVVEQEAGDRLSLRDYLGTKR